MKTPELIINSDSFSFTSFFTSEASVSLSEIEFPNELIIGKQAEFLFETLLKLSSRYIILLSNIQIQGRDRTLGELDYLVLDRKTSSTLHIELACKFYLFDASLGDSPEAPWIGPNRKDRLIDKLGKLKKQQFPLLYRKETREQLLPLQIDINSVQQQLCLKAFLFIPKELSKEVFPKNYQSCIYGYWIHSSDFSSEDKDALYRITNKKEWLLPPVNLSEWQHFSEVEKKIKESIGNKKSILIYKKRNTNIQPIFVIWW
ncbi:DUF1853 family protein [Ulvibacter antarcticus]|uniref:DUF1853 family protein n=1 Tax=Ulvibacter antarcticus TaxID=442714 RepID=A0A3L9YJ02_9FLAO|nr:DUF1853 family protein [Ulvibacter antarcticus]RMA57918.1 hypothetical protein BXY75_2725 [Ulvibacter antarcticus]